MNPIRQETASNISLLPRDSIVDTVSRLRASRKIFTDLDVNIDALLEEVNDLLSAMGLVADDEFGDEFIRQTASKDTVSANLHEDYEAGQLDDLSVLSGAALACANGTALRGYLQDMLSAQFTPSHGQTALTTTCMALESLAERLQDDANASRHDRANATFGTDCLALANHLNGIAVQLRSVSATAQLNAALRRKQSARDFTSINHEFGIVSYGHQSLIEHLTAVQQSAEDIALFKRSQIREHRTRDDQLNGLLFGLADIFLSLTQANTDYTKLTTPFVEFATDILQPYLNDRDLSPEAIAKRWQRLRQEAKKAA